MAQSSLMDGHMQVKPTFDGGAAVTGDGTNDGPVGKAGIEVTKQRANAIILNNTVSSIFAGGAYIYNIRKLVLLKNVLPLIVYFSSASLTDYASGNVQLIVVLVCILGGAKKSMYRRLLSFFILMGLALLLEIQVVEGRGLKAVADVNKVSFNGSFSAEKKADPIAYPPPVAAQQGHH